MNKLIICLILLGASTFVSAQTRVIEEKAQKSSTKMIQAFELNEEQAEKMFKIQFRRYAQLTEVEPLRSSDPQQYIKKLKAISSGYEGAFNLILKTRKQFEAFEQYQKDLRQKRLETKMELKKQGLTEIEIEEQLFAIE